MFNFLCLKLVVSPCIPTPVIFPFMATEIYNNSWYSDLDLFLWYSVRSQDKLPSFVNCSQNHAKRTNSRRPAFTHDRIFKVLSHCVTFAKLFN